MVRRAVSIAESVGAPQWAPDRLGAGLYGSIASYVGQLRCPTPHCARRDLACAGDQLPTDHAIRLRATRLSIPARAGAGHAGAAVIRQRRYVFSLLAVRATLWRADWGVEGCWPITLQRQLVGLVAHTCRCACTPLGGIAENAQAQRSARMAGARAVPHCGQQGHCAPTQAVAPTAQVAR